MINKQEYRETWYIQKLFQKTIREFCEREIKPLASKIDQEEYFPFELYKKMGKMGMMGMTIPQEYGGAGIDKVSYMIALEEISRFCGSTGLNVEAHNTLGCGYIYEHGSDEQRKKYHRSPPVMTWAPCGPSSTRRRRYRLSCRRRSSCSARFFMEKWGNRGPQERIACANKI